MTLGDEERFFLAARVMIRPFLGIAIFVPSNTVVGIVGHAIQHAPSNSDISRAQQLVPALCLEAEQHSAVMNVPSDIVLRLFYRFAEKRLVFCLGHTTVHSANPRSSDLCKPFWKTKRSVKRT